MELTRAVMAWAGGPQRPGSRVHACIYVMPTLDSDTAITATPGILRGLPDKSKYEHQRRLDGANNVPLLWKIRAPGMSGDPI